MGLFDENYITGTIFDDEFYDDITGNIEDAVYEEFDSLIMPKFGDCILYNKHTQRMYIRNYIDIEKEQESAVIGIVLQVNPITCAIDCIMKNFLTTDIQLCTIRNMVTGDNNAASAHMKQLFDRYNQKYKRTTNMEFIKTINYYIPNIALLDYLWENRNTFFELIEKIYDTDKAVSFKELFYTGVLSTYKNKLYVWCPDKTDNTRKINHLIKHGRCLFLSCFTLTNNFSNYE